MAPIGARKSWETGWISSRLLRLRRYGGLRGIRRRSAKRNFHRRRSNGGCDSETRRYFEKEKENENENREAGAVGSAVRPYLLQIETHAVFAGVDFSIGVDGAHGLSHGFRNLWVVGKAFDHEVFEHDSFHFGVAGDLADVFGS